MNMVYVFSIISLLILIFKVIKIEFYTPFSFFFFFLSYVFMDDFNINQIIKHLTKIEEKKKMESEN